MNLIEIKRSVDILTQEYVRIGGQPSRDPKHNPCPFCEDKTGFSLYADKDGIARYKCWSCSLQGTAVDLLMEAGKIDSRDAIKVLTDRYGNTPPTPVKARPQAKSDDSGRHFMSADEVEDFWVRIFAKDGGKHQATWNYEDEVNASWTPVIKVVRCVMPGGKKEIRPSRRVATGWRAGLGSYGTDDRLVPLLNKRRLALAEPETPLHVVEGEKCADSLAKYGFLVTTSLQGSSYAERSDWTPATKFNRVYIWLDLDATDPRNQSNPGRKYVSTVQKALDTSNQEVSVVNIRPLGYKDGEDVADFVEALEQEGLSPEAIVSSILEVAETCIDVNLGDLYPDQPAPLPMSFGEFEDSADRPHIRNWYPELVKFKAQEKQKDENGKQVIVEVEKQRTDKMQLSPMRVVKRITQLTSEAVCRIRAPGAREPLLFLETRNCKSEGRIQWMQNTAQFRALLQRLGKLQFVEKRAGDPEGTQYANPTDVFHTFAESPDVREYEAIQVRPHMPPIPGHYYAWRPSTDYQPTGTRLAGLLKFFTNAKASEHLAMICAAILTPAWGGTADVRYGCRPLLVLTAADQGSGKTTIAHVIGELWGGWLPVALTQRAEDEFIQRALSPGGMLTRVAVIDNVLSTLKSAAIEGWITEKYIRGKRMYQGDASRPNDLTWFVTLNNAKLSRDMAQRAFFIELKKPEATANWAKDCAAYIARHGIEIILDCLAILSTPIPHKSLGLHDRWAPWAEGVLARACASNALREAAGSTIDVRKVLDLNNEHRAECDIDREQATEVWLGIAERVSKDYLSWDSGGRKVTMPHETADDRFVPSKLMMAWMLAIQGRRELNAAWIRSFIDGHHKAGRLPYVWYQRDSNGRGYRVAMEGIRKYLETLRENPEIGPQQGDITDE